MTVNSFWKQTWRLYYAVLDLFLPPLCVGCERVDVWLCDACAAKLALLTSQPVCSRCGKPWQSPGVCGVCQKTPLHVAPIRSTFLFGDQIQAAIHALKYRAGAGVVAPLARRMAEAWRAYEMHSDLLTPVPLYPPREIRRSYNQSALLAQALGTHLGIPSGEVLSRVRNTPSQTHLKREQRQENVKEAFMCKPDADVVGKCVTLIDDVATTGATLDACAVALLSKGARMVNAFTLARAA